MTIKERITITSAAALLLCAIPSRARAELQFGVETNLELTRGIGVRARLELPVVPIFASAGIGFLPGFAADLADSLSFPPMSQGPVSDIIRKTMDNSWIFRLGAGVRPMMERGLYLELGYSVVALGGTDALGTAVAAAAEGQASMNAGTTAYAIGGRSQIVDLEVGWRWFITANLTIRVAGGLAYTFDTSHSIEATNVGTGMPLDAQTVRQGVKQLDEGARRFTPTAAVALGWQFL